ncbi:hypothetical protein JHK87_057086 [Glycine soja]|nr:hypothetical protein JHK87_057086 [Glycine soja]
MSDEQILEEIYSTHVGSDTNVDSLFTLLENTLRRSTLIVDNFGSHASLEHIDDKIPQLDSPLCLLKQISFELSPNNPLAKSVAILKRVPVLTRQAALQKHRQTIVEYKIVWIPIVEEWTVEYDNKFEDFKCKMPWFAVQHSRTIASLYMVVVLSPQGKVQHSNAFHLIQAHGKRAFPFTFVKQEQINNEIYWVGSEIGNIYPIINTWFTKNVSILASDAAITEANISIEWLCVEKEDKSVMRRFWGGIESLFVTKVHKAVDAVTQEVQKMLSFKNESGWDGSPY